jgi:hypothetical protein
VTLLRRRTDLSRVRLAVAGDGSLHDGARSADAAYPAIGGWQPSGAAARSPFPSLATRRCSTSQLTHRLHCQGALARSSGRSRRLPGLAPDERRKLARAGAASAAARAGFRYFR